VSNQEALDDLRRRLIALYLDAIQARGIPCREVLHVLAWTTGEMGAIAAVPERAMQAKQELRGSLDAGWDHRALADAPTAGRA
jgi:hypothetical protein